jgi:hypothetical protein
MFRTILALSLLTASLTFAGVPQASAQSDKTKCWSARSCGGKVLNNSKSCSACKKSGGKSWSSTAGVCTKSC